jgi:hypothetical protein
MFHVLMQVPNTVRSFPSQLRLLGLRGGGGGGGGGGTRTLAHTHMPMPNYSRVHGAHPPTLSRAHARHPHTHHPGPLPVCCLLLCALQVVKHLMRMAQTSFEKARLMLTSESAEVDEAMEEAANTAQEVTWCAPPP